MIKKLFFPAVLFFALAKANIVFSQQYNAVEGAVIGLNNDTIPGLIRNRDDLSTSLSFKATHSDSYEEFVPGDIKGFLIQGRYFYESVSLQSKKAFMLQLIRGYFGLYQDKNTMYVRTAGGEHIELPIPEDKVVDRKLIEDKRYVRTLAYLTSDCANIRTKIETVSYNALELSKIIETYNKCMRPEDEQHSSGSIVKPKVSVGIRGGISSNDFYYFVSDSRYYDQKFNTNTGTYTGAVVNFTHNNKLSFQAELIVTNKEATFKGDVSNYVVEGFFIDSVFISYSYLEIPLSIYYSLLTKFVQPFISAGGMYGMALKQEVVRMVNERDVPLEMNNDVVGIRLGAGIAKQFKNSTVAFEYLYTSNLVNRTYQDKAKWKGHCITAFVTFNLRK